MTSSELQQWLIDHGQPVTVDGQCGPLTRGAILMAFGNTQAPAVTDADIQTLADRLGCQPKQLMAMAKVESGRSAFDDSGRPKMLFERHLFYRLSKEVHDPSPWNNPQSGGYNLDSWFKLTHAACEDADAAFSSASWGRFQVLGLHWAGLGYSSPLELAYSTVESEAAHYELLARYIERNNLKGALARISTNPADNVAIARAYNGPGFKAFRYDEKLAEAMA